MSPTPDLDLVHKVKETGNEAALCELADRHSGVYFKTVQQYAPFNRVDDIYDDFYRRKEAEVYKAVLSFDENKGVKFVTWLAAQTKYSCLTERTRQKKQADIYNHNFEFCEVCDDTPETQYLEKERAQEAIKFLEDNCNPRIAKIFKEKFFGNDGRGVTLKEIADREKVSHQAIQQLYAIGMEKLKKKFVTQ